MARQVNILEILNTSPSVALLRARSCNLIIEFFTGVFEDTTAISHENIHSLLADFLNDHGVEVDEENDILFLTHTRRKRLNTSKGGLKMVS